MSHTWDLLRSFLKPFVNTADANLSAQSNAVYSLDQPATKIFGSEEADQYDPLTGLATAGPFREQVRRHMALARRHGKLTAVLYIGLNDISRVNESFGSRFGDILIRQAAFRLHASVRQSDMLARVGGVCFAIVLEPFDEVEDATNVAGRLLDIVGETFSLFELTDNPIGISANAGISLFPTHAENEEELMNNAAIALSKAGANGMRRVEMFSLEHREESKVRLELEWMLRRALDRQEFWLSYQPEVDLHSGRVIRREALLRWLHPTRGPITPAQFIPAAEDTGLIGPLGAWALREACTRASQWQLAGHEGLGVAVNVSPVQLIRPDFSQTVDSVLSETGLPGQLLELELTETALISNLDKSISEVTRLRSSGISVVIDDFGVGYSSLSYLKELPVNGVKLDRSFLRDLEGNPNTLPLLRSIVGLAHGLKMRVTVEGVETQEQLQAVQSLGVDAAQGFLLGRPSSLSGDPDL